MSGKMIGPRLKDLRRSMKLPQWKMAELLGVSPALTVMSATLPQLLKKNQTSISQDVEGKVLSMYAKGMTTGDIETHIRDIYGLEVLDTTVSRITDKILPVAKEWQQRPLESVYAVVFLDAIHYHVRSEGQVVKKAVYITIGVNLDA